MRDRDSLILESLYHTILEKNGMGAEYAELERRSKDGDEEAQAEAQRMVDDMAKEAGYTIRANHSSPYAGITKFNRRYKTEVLDMPNLIDESIIWFREGVGGDRYGSNKYQVFLKLSDPWTTEGRIGGENGWNKYARMVETIAEDGNPETFVNHMKRQGWDGVKISNVDLDFDRFTVYGVFDSDQIKSADPFTYDDNGELIPLSQRFDSSKDDIRY